MALTVSKTKIYIIRCDHPGCHRQDDTMAPNVSKAVKNFKRKAPWSFGHDGSTKCQEHNPTA